MESKDNIVLIQGQSTAMGSLEQLLGGQETNSGSRHIVGLHLDSRTVTMKVTDCPLHNSLSMDLRLAI